MLRNIALLIVVAGTAWSQKFEVAAVKPASGCVGGRGGGLGGRGGTSAGAGSSPGRLNLNCQTVLDLIKTAYGFYATGHFTPGRVAPIEGGPAWIRSDTYTIEAKADGTASQATMSGPMLQALLEDRFQLKIHHESREVPVYELTVGKGGPQLEAFQEGSCTPADMTELPLSARDPAVTYCDNNGMSMSMTMSSPNMSVSRQRMSVDDFCRAILSGNVDRPVINKTGIAGLFNFHLEFAQEGNTDEALRRMAESAAPGLREQMLAVLAARANGPAAISIFAAVQNQLGLKLEAAKGPGDFMVIDRVERPSEN